MKALATILTVILLCVFASSFFHKTASTPVPTPVQSTSELPLTHDNLLRLVNDERAKVGVAPLTIDPMLNQSAQWKANDQEAYGYFGHVKPGETGNNALDFLQQLDNASGDRCDHISENLTWMTDDSELTATAAVQWWKGSESHYKAMIDPSYTLTGFGILHDSAVQHFCHIR